MSELKPKQKQLYNYLVDFYEQWGRVPEREEVREHFKWSAVGIVDRAIERLEPFGLARITPREIELMEVVEIDPNCAAIQDANARAVKANARSDRMLDVCEMLVKEIKGHTLRTETRNLINSFTKRINDITDEN